MTKKNILLEVAQWWEQSEEFQRGLQNYDRIIQSKEWKFIRDLLLGLQGVIANDVLSRGFTSLSATEKDVQQRSYYQTIQILEFLLNPIKWMKKQRRWKDHQFKGQ